MLLQVVPVNLSCKHFLAGFRQLHVQNFGLLNNLESYFLTICLLRLWRAERLAWSWRSTRIRGRRSATWLFSSRQRLSWVYVLSFKALAGTFFWWFASGLKTRLCSWLFFFGRLLFCNNFEECSLLLRLLLLPFHLFLHLNELLQLHSFSNLFISTALLFLHAFLFNSFAIFKVSHVSSYVLLTSSLFFCRIIGEVLLNLYLFF